MTQQFKHDARVAALISFIRVMKLHKLYMEFINEAYIFFKNEQSKTIDSDSERNRKTKRGERNGLLSNIFATTKENGNLWEVILKFLTPKIDYNFEHMRRGGGEGEEYEYLVHCVNTCIQIFIEHGMCHNNSDRSYPRFEEIGLQAFQVAGKKLWGDNFRPQEQIRPREDFKPCDEEELRIVRNILQEVGGNTHISQQEIFDRISRAIAEKRERENAMSNIDNYDAYDDGDDDEYIEWYDEDAEEVWND